MVYATYDYYKNDFGGVTVPEDDFPAAAARASRYLDAITMGRIGKIGECSEPVMNACCAAAEIAWRYSKYSSQIAEAGTKSSESVGDYSVTYRTSEITQNASRGVSEFEQVEMYTAVKPFLYSTGVLYRGLC